jgi:hypothetical protein
MSEPSKDGIVKRIAGAVGAVIFFAFSFVWLECQKNNSDSVYVDTKRSVSVPNTPEKKAGNTPIVAESGKLVAVIADRQRAAMRDAAAASAALAPAAERVVSAAPARATPPPEPSKPVSVKTRRRPVTGCVTGTAEDLDRANRWSENAGYGYLKNRGDIICRWRVAAETGNPTDPIVWLAQNGYDSPLAECSHTVSFRPEEVKEWPGVIMKYHGIEYYADLDKRMFHPFATFKTPCYVYDDAIFYGGIQVKKEVTSPYRWNQ